MKWKLPIYHINSIEKKSLIARITVQINIRYINISANLFLKILSRSYKIIEKNNSQHYGSLDKKYQQLKVMPTSK
jgi:hypothetical protein